MIFFGVSFFLLSLFITVMPSYGQVTNATNGETVVNPNNFFRQDSFYSNGLPKSEDYYQNGQLWQRIVFTYDTDGRLVATRLFEPVRDQMLLKELTTYLYNNEDNMWQMVKNNKLSFYTQTSILSQLDQGLRFLTLKDGLLKQIYQQKGARGENTEFAFNKDGQMTMARFTLENNQLEEYYDSEGRVVKTVFLHNSEALETFIYGFNKLGLLVEQRHNVAGGDNELQRFTYNSKQELVKTSIYQGTQLLRELVPIVGGQEVYYYRDGRLIYIEKEMNLG